ncbi:uncharacterized protein N7479_003164 [Penicillium vulpinum]|uniref:uncharacterized protein n=1 Tax=Penicillium vulpinum TaxID=29845 RepID=UPI0025480393|nr:uncharacterized protein N7479_003164 [Penicillium vulpinum]KAJ5963288.1 hypothetical protein N7479_003164 [Penicillium vulpinum]
MPDGYTNLDFVDGIAHGTPGMLDDLSARDWPALDEQANTQSIMVVVVNRKACEEGWVSFLAPNYKGEVLSFRVRERASWVSQLVLEFMEGQSLEENTVDPDQDVECYMRENPHG